MFFSQAILDFVHHLDWAKARSLIAEGFLNALVDDFASLPTYWEGMKRVYPNHPVSKDQCRWANSLGCTIYCNLFVLKKLLNPFPTLKTSMDNSFGVMIFFEFKTC